MVALRRSGAHAARQAVLECRRLHGDDELRRALTEAQAVIAGGYTLDPSFVHNFQADNNTSPELVFVAPQDGNNTQTWGGMTFLIHAGCGGSMSAANYGIDYCWAATG